MSAVLESQLDALDLAIATLQRQSTPDDIDHASYANAIDTLWTMRIELLASRVPL